MTTTFPPRAWEVLLLGGPSGAGKTSVSYRLAQHFGIGITEVDDFQVILEAMTTPAEQPEIHFWRTHPEAADLAAAEMLHHALAVGRVMTRALALVVTNHLESQAPIILEGDFIHPALLEVPALQAAVAAGHVRAVFIYEESEAQLRENFRQREPEAGVQAKRSQVSWLYGQWLRTEAERVGALALPARPWDDVFTRITRALAEG